MRSTFSALLSSLVLLSLVLFSGQSLAASSTDVVTLKTYTVAKDYRRCAYPLCGGWYLTPVNQYSLTLQTEEQAIAQGPITTTPIYVARVDYRRLGLTPAQIAELEYEMESGQALLKGSITLYQTTSTYRVNQLVLNNAWVGANDTEALGPYLNVTSSGIVCVTTPCPYYNAAIINTTRIYPAHELNFSRAYLDPEQVTQAWREVSSRGLVMTGVTYTSKGQTGTGTGIAATKVFFPFPK